MPATCLKTVVGGMSGHAPVEYFCSNEFYGDHKNATKLRLIWPPSVLGTLPHLNSGVYQSENVWYAVTHVTLLCIFYLWNLYIFALWC